MNTGVEHMACGGCGNGLFRMFRGEDGCLIAECTLCESETVITVEAQLKLGWGSAGHDKGRLCLMKPTQEKSA